MSVSAKFSYEPQEGHKNSSPMKCDIGSPRRENKREGDCFENENDLAVVKDERCGKCGFFLPSVIGSKLRKKSFLFFSKSANLIERTK